MSLRLTFIRGLIFPYPNIHINFSSRWLLKDQEERGAAALLENSLLQLNLVIAQFPGSCNKWPAFYGVNTILCEGKYRDH